jgi:hypothetical protein
MRAQRSFHQLRSVGRAAAGMAPGTAAQASAGSRVSDGNAHRALPIRTHRAPPQERQIARSVTRARALLAASSARSHPTCRHHSDTADATHVLDVKAQASTMFTPRSFGKVGVEAYAAYALRAWLARDRSISIRTRRFAEWSAICAFALGMAGQIAYHLMAQAGTARAPWPVTTLVSCLPVLVLTMGTALAHMLRRRRRRHRYAGQPDQTTSGPTVPVLVLAGPRRTRPQSAGG